MVNKKIIIEITEGHNYDESVNDGRPFTSVHFQASTYGCGAPCDSEDEIQEAIKHQKEWIVKEGDIPIVEDKRVKMDLLSYLQ